MLVGSLKLWLVLVVLLSSATVCRGRGVAQPMGLCRYLGMYAPHHVVVSRGDGIVHLTILGARGWRPRFHSCTRGVLSRERTGPVPLVCLPYSSRIRNGEGGESWDG